MKQIIGSDDKFVKEINNLFVKNLFKCVGKPNGCGVDIKDNEFK